MQSNEPHTEPSFQPLVQQILVAFAGTYKKRNLYVASHTVYQNALDALIQLFDALFHQTERLKLNVEQDRILYDGAAVYEGATEPTDLAFILHRDGLISITFREGLQRCELDTLITICHEHAVLTEDAEEDIVTALWKVNLPSLMYEAAELTLGASDTPALEVLEGLWQNPPTAPRSEMDPPSETVTAAEQPAQTVFIPALGDRMALFQISDDEREQLRKMVVAEERMDGAAYVVDVLLYILTRHSVPEDVDDLLNTLFQELHDTLSQCRFAYLHAVLMKLKHHLADLEARCHWSAPHLGNFLISLAGDGFLEGLLALSPPLDQCPSETSKHLKKILVQLDNSAIGALGPIMFRTSSAALQRVLLETIAIMARKDFAPLGILIQDCNADLASRLIYILGFLKDIASRQLLTRMLRHPAPPVRRQALKAILTRSDESLEEIFPLIDDPEDSVRKLVLQRLSRERNRLAENLLLAHLGQNPNGSDDEEHIMDLYRVLGRCGSDHALPFLRTKLFRWPLLGVLAPPASRHRRGTEVALEAIGTASAIGLLQRSRRGFILNLLRSA